MKRFLLRSALLLAACAFPALAAEDDDKTAARDALKALHEFIGDWNGNGGPPRNAKGAAKDVWSEKLHWGWKFAKGDAWLTIAVDDGKHFKGGELKYLVDKKKYELTMEDTKGKKLVYLGDLKDETLTFERVDPTTKDTHQLKMNTAAEGIRLIYRAAKKRSGSTLYAPEYEVACNRAGESLGARAKKNECIVSGGLGTSTVSYKGQTFWVCCSGCRDAFNENPEKYIKEYEEAKKKKKG